MPTKNYTLEFRGYWRFANLYSIPNEAGIYCTYTCTYNEKGDTVSIDKLIYIGEAKLVHDRIVNHEHMPVWDLRLSGSQELCFSFAPILHESDRKRAEAALIYAHKPPLNKKYVYRFPFERTIVAVYGKCEKLSQSDVNP